eukprot:15359902-Alexandrium_andersonii.AAC.1
MRSSGTGAFPTGRLPTCAPGSRPDWASRQAGGPCWPTRWGLRLEPTPPSTRSASTGSRRCVWYLALGWTSMGGRPPRLTPAQLPRRLAQARGRQLSPTSVPPVRGP